MSTIAARQYGLVTRAQLEALGYGTNVIARRVRSGAWIRVLPTVYRLASVFERDRRRWADLTSAGWRLVPVTWREVSRRPEEFVRRVRAARSEGHAGDGAAGGEDGRRA